MTRQPANTLCDINDVDCDTCTFPVYRTLYRTLYRRVNRCSFSPVVPTALSVNFLAIRARAFHRSHSL